ncbi:hypothetical protein QMT40_001655 [Parvibaculaceae bacterium PLY_AMNH_Bact1]|nr:hypothetical protein QMT40_001655 [Parvibaculaceae bacterium PLY_AMNH_Bact1]
MKLLKPTIDHIPAYLSALGRGWSPDNLRPEAAQEQTAAISKDAISFVSKLDDPTAQAGPIILPDGSKVSRFSTIWGKALQARPDRAQIWCSALMK